MELMFNELSMYPLAADKYIANARAISFAETASEARKMNIRIIKSDSFTESIKLTDDYTLHDWLVDKDFSKANHTYRDFLYGMIKPPFAKKTENGYLQINSCYFEDMMNGIKKTQCLGLFAAYYNDSVAISFQSNNAWTKNILAIIIKNDVFRNESVKNVYSKECFSKDDIVNFIRCMPVETTIMPDDKACHLADHHGKPELQGLWNKLKNSPYIESAQSADWGGNRFIRKIERNGVIEIVLVDSAKKYALKVQTTGKNYTETKIIADKLKEEYS